MNTRGTLRVFLVFMLLLSYAILSRPTTSHADKPLPPVEPLVEGNGNVPLEPRPVPTKPTHTEVESGQATGRIIVRFVEGSDVLWQEGNLVSLSGKDLAAVKRALADAPNVHLERLYSGLPARLDAERLALERSSGKQLADLNLAFLLSLPSANNEQIAAVIDELNADPLVELAYPESIVVDPSVMQQGARGNYTAQQGYLDTATANGIDARYAWTQSGGRGQGVTIIDLEHGWNFQHEDLAKAQTALLSTGSSSDTNHGTAVIGEMVGDDNLYGVTGIVPDAALGLVSWSTPDSGLNAPQAVQLARETLGPGDIMLLEGQIAGPAGTGTCTSTDQDGCVAMDWDTEVYNNVEFAIAEGIVVVEAAGNGGNDLDDAAYQQRFDRETWDSGAIMVGAGHSDVACSGGICPRQRLDFSNYGGRLDLQGWGENVTSTGSGDLYPGGSPPDTTYVNQFYTNLFAGTSSASPIVAGAAAALQGVARQRLGAPLLPEQVRKILGDTGSPQTGETGEHIGPLPNLRRAIDEGLVVRPGFDANTLAGNDDGSTGLVPIGFPVNFFGNAFESLYVNNNGNVTFDYTLSTYTPFDLNSTSRIIIAPFFADVDTRTGNVLKYGSGTIGSRAAFAVTWPGVGCYSRNTSVLNVFQVVLVSRSDVGVGDFDIEFNYDRIQWETGQASGGNGNCLSGSPARVGYSNGSGTSFELPGSAVPGSFQDTNLTTGLANNRRNSLLPGRYVFEVRNGVVPTGGTIAGIVFANNTATPLANALVQVCAAAAHCNTTRADTSGQYSVSALAAGEYQVTAFPATGVNVQPGSIGPLTLTEGQILSGQDLILNGPQPLPAGTTITNRGTGSNGVPILYWNEDLTLTTTACAGGTATYEIVQDGTTVRNGGMAEGPTETYTAVIAPLYPLHGNARVLIHITCPVGTTVDIPFDIYIDPSGHIRTVGGTPIPGATVTLFRSDSSGGPFELVPDGSDIMSPENRHNPDTTDAEGRFGWNVFAGFYVVRAQAVGCVSPADPTQSFVESGVLEVPPAVTDLDLRLQCNLPPTANAGGPYTVAEGGQIALNGTGSDPDADPVAYAWDLNNDGTFETPGQSVTFSAAERDGPDTQTVVLQVCDDNGACTPATATVTITNVPPVVTNDRPAQTVHSGDAIAVVTVSATDLTSDLAFSVSSTWTKDGGAPETGLPAGLTLTAGACTPDDGATTCIWTLTGNATAAPATYVVTVAVSDHDGDAGSTNIAVTIVNQPPTADAGGPYTVAEGGQVTLNGTGSDPDTDPVAYAWDLNNDGAFETPGQSVTFSAAERDGPDTQTVVLQVCDDNGACTPATATVTITNVPPVVTNDRPAQTVHSGDAIAAVAVSATDLTSDQPFAGSSSWTKDGGAAQTGLPAGLTLTAGACTPASGATTCIWTLAGSATAAPATYVVTVSVNDHDGDAGATDIAVTIVNLPPTANAGGPYTVAEGGQIALNGTGSDPDADPVAYAWDLNNDGTFETPGQSVTFSAAERDGPDTQPVVLQVCDDNGGCTPATATVTITNVPPVVTNDRPTQSLRVGQAIAAVTVSATDLTSDQPFAGSSSWTKDGGAARTGLPAGLTLAPGACTPSGVKTTCIWTLAGSKVAVGAYVVTVSIRDHDGGASSTDIAVTVSPARILLPLVVR